MLNLLGGDHVYRRKVDGDGREEPHTFHWLADSLVRIASSSPWDWAVALLQGLEGKGDQGGRQLGVGCGADLAAD